MPLRPIIDYTGSKGYNISRSLVDLLLIMCSTLKALKQLAEDMKDAVLEDDKCLASHDVSKY